MRRLTIFLALMTLSSAWAALLLGVDCPQSVYGHEVFTCSIVAQETDTPRHIKLYVHGAKGVLEVLTSNVELTAGGLPSSAEVNLWATDVGVDTLIVDVTEGERMAVLKALRFVPPPISVAFSPLRVESGSRAELEVRLSGNVLNVRVWLEAPPYFDVSHPVTVGDLFEDRTVKLFLVPALGVVGDHVVYLNVYFEDLYGPHVLRYPVRVQVSPPIFMMGIGIGLLFALILVLYVFWKRKKASGAQ